MDDTTQPLPSQSPPAPVASAAPKSPNDNTQSALDQILADLEKQYKEKGDEKVDAPVGSMPPTADAVHASPAAPTMHSQPVPMTSNTMDDEELVTSIPKPAPKLSSALEAAVHPNAQPSMKMMREDGVVAPPAGANISPSPTPPANAGGGFLKKVGGAKFVVGALGLFVAISGLMSVLVLTKQPGTGDVRQQASSNACDDCGSANQGGCFGSEANCPGLTGGGCKSNLVFCGGGCYPAGWRACPGQAGCRNPDIACSGSDQCSGVNCPTGQHCNGGFCVNDDSGGGDNGHKYTYKKFICPKGCGSDNQCTGEDPNVSVSDVSSSTTLGTNDCGQIDQFDNGNYIQVKQISCGSSACGTSTPPPTSPPTSPPREAPVCRGISSSNAAPTLGQNVIFTCAQANRANKYQFRYKLNAGNFQNLDPVTENASTSKPLTIAQTGTYVVQCRPCDGETCAAWGSAGTVSSEGGSGTGGNGVIGNGTGGNDQMTCPEFPGCKSFRENTGIPWNICWGKRETRCSN